MIDLIDRRHFMLATGGMGAMALAGCSARGGDASFPGQDINFIIPYGPGGGFDSYVRVVVAPLARALPHKVNVIPLNVEGAGGGKAISQLFQARPDGSNIAVIGIPGGIGLEVLQGSAALDLTKLSWIGNMGTDAYGIAVGVNSPVKTVDDLKALSAKRPVKFTAAGVGSTGRAGALIASKMLGLRSEIITGYKGTSEYLVAAARGDGDAAVCSLTSMQTLVRAGVIRPLASFEPRSSIAGVPGAIDLGQPDLSKIGEFRPVAGPPNLPKPIQTILADALRKALASPEVADWAKKNGATITPATPEETLKIIQDQTQFMQKWKDVLSAT